MSTTSARPPTVTLACVFLGLTGALWLFVAGSTLSDWTSLETQQQVREMVETSPVGASADTLVEIARITLMVTAALAAGAVVFAIYAARGHPASRIMLTVQAAILALVFGVTGIQGLIPSAFAIACVVLLWNAEARHWYSVKNGKLPAAADPPVVARSSDAPVPAVQHHPAADRTSATPGEAQPSTAVADRPRPRPALAAGVLTIVGSTVGFFVGVYLFVAGERFGVQIEEQVRGDDRFASLYSDIEEGTLAQAVTMLGGSMVALSLLGLLAAILLMNRTAVGRILLYIASGGTIAMSLLTFPLGLVTGAVAIYVIVLISKADVRTWLASP